MNAQERHEIPTEIDLDVAIAFNDSESKNGYYNGAGNQSAQTAVLRTYENKVIPLEKKIEILQLDGLLGGIGIENKESIDLWLCSEIASWMHGGNSARNEALPEGYIFLIADVDGLKQINGEDSQGVRRGHDMGDATLFMIGRSLAEVGRPNDKKARKGGDEFLVAISASSAVVDTMMNGESGVLERLRSSVSRGREKLIKQFYDRWPADTDQRKLGEISVGWQYLSRTEMIEMYKKFEMIPLEERTTNFTGYLTQEADNRMFINKSRVRN